jgi:hypothetical protein
MVGPSPHQGHPNCPTKKGPLPPVLHGPLYQTRWNQGTVYVRALSSNTYTQIESAKEPHILVFSSSLSSPFSFPVSNLQCSPPRSRACSPRLTNNEPLTQMVAAAYQPVFLPHPPRHSCFIKLSAVPALPGCAFLVLTEAFPIPPRPIYSLRATNFTRFPHREARNSSPLP